MARQSTPDPVPVLLTRPKAQSQVFARALAARFGDRVQPVITPLMAPVFLTPDLPEGPHAAVIFTSATGVVAAVRLGADLPKRAYCVGRQTAARARKAGFQALSAEGDADALVAAVQADRPSGQVLHLRGEDTRGDVAERLNSAGIETHSVVIYRQEPQAMTPEALDLLASATAVIVPLFSPRTAAVFRGAMPKGSRARLRIAAISAAVAKAAEGLALEAIEVASHPDAEAMLDAVERLLDKRPAP
ncbi:MAG: uroporphyrinogen-III synthase [Rhodobacter sp.]|nr:uroporphyrinogen-III synthase [Rhodobacter sp.]